MMSPTFIYCIALLVVTWLCVCCEEQESLHRDKRGARESKFLEGQQEEKHTIVKRGAAPSNCHHNCPGGDVNCYYDNTISDYRCKCPCRSQYCTSIVERCNNRGTCVEISGTDFTCSNCIAGWKGKQCHLIDCDSGMYCKNGGVCMNDVSSGTDYRCICKEGWTGRDCQVIDCSWPGYCNDRGTCVPTATNTDYTCSNCATGWKGKSCHLVDCNSGSYCTNGVVCVENGADYTCTCKNGWNGKNCQLVVCTWSGHCNDRGTCVPTTTNTDYMCSNCASGWKGKSCHLVDCNSGSYCTNGGTCVENGADYTCTCKNGWNGKNCQLVVCTWSGHCNDRGTCVPTSTNTDYTCSNCASGWKGKSCHLVDCNSGIYCKNGGVCVDDVSSGTDYRCICKEGWIGKDCQFIDCASPIRCLNDGECHLQNGGMEFSCTCAKGYLGDNCQIDMCSPYMIADIVMVIDVSDSQTNTVFQELKENIKRLISQFPVGPNHFQFSIILYGKQPHVVFHLNNTHDNDTILDAVENMTIPDTIRGPTFTGEALEFVYKESFRESNGGRSEVDRYVLVLTDGMASDRLKTLEQAKLLSTIPNNQVVGVGAGKYVLHEELLAITDTVRNVHPLFGDNTIVSLLKRTMFGCDRCTTSYSDLALAFDVASFGYEQLEESLKVAEVLMANIHTGINQTRVSLSKTVGGIGETVFNCNMYNDSSQMIPAMYRGIMKEDSCHTKDCSSGNLAALIQHLAVELDADQGRKIVAVVFTQGHVADRERNFVVNEGKRLKDNGVILVVGGVGREANDELMLQLSTSSFFVFLVGEDVVTSVDVITALLSTLEYDSCYDIQTYPIFDSYR